MLQAVNNKVVIKVNPQKEKSEGGIILPGQAKEAPNTGTVVSVGEGRTLIDGSLKPLTVKIGDVVVFTSFGNCEVAHGGEKYTIIPDDNILAIVK